MDHSDNYKKKLSIFKILTRLIFVSVSIQNKKTTWNLSIYTHYTHTRLFLWKVGTLHRRNGFYTVLTVCAIVLHLNLPLTGDCAFQLSPKKPHSVWFISVLKSGDMGQCPEKSPSPCNTCHTLVIIHIYVLICHKNARTHTHTNESQK